MKPRQQIIRDNSYPPGSFSPTIESEKVYLYQTNETMQTRR
jgi:hypothetical protein